MPRLPASAALAATLLFVAAPLRAQLEPPSTGGAAAMEHALRMLGHTKRVLVIGAHPDDEDTELITLLVRGMGTETAYLSLNRGEGGQNLIGPELGDALGVLRTEELLSARRLDGARQFFTRAFDFGYSKTLDDTWAHWPRDSVLKDVVRVIRAFQPQIVVSIFTGTPRDGHGQHQAAGWAALNAFEAAADSSRYPELAREEGLTPWRPLKLYRTTRFDTAATTLTLQSGVLDPAVGQSYHQVAMRGRSRHRSQDMGVLQRPGPSVTRLALVADRTGRGGGRLWDGIDTLVARDVQAVAAAPAALLTLDSAITRARAAGRRPPASILDYRARVNDALVLERRLVLDAVAVDGRVTTGQELEVAVSLWNAGDAPVDARFGLEGVATASAEPVHVAPGEMVTRTLAVAIPADASTEPYHLRLPRAGWLYRWNGAADRGAATEPPLLTAVARVDGGIIVRREVSYRWNDQASGEKREPLLVVPRVGVALDRDLIVHPLDSHDPHSLTVTLMHGARDTTEGELRLEVPAGWPAPAPQRFRLTREDERATFTFRLVVPAGLHAGTAEVRAVAVTTAGTHYDTGLQEIAYEHIRRRAITRPAVATVRLLPLTLPALSLVGYVRGAADRVPEALRDLRIPLVELSADSLERGDLGRYSAIVIGPRAYETMPALTAQNDRILEFARRGGLVLVQYQQYTYFQGQFAPYALAVGGQPLPTDLARLPQAGTTRGSPLPDRHDRVADELAPVRMTDPANPVVRSPNAIASADWDGWVQERGLYFAREWDASFRPMLEMHDPGEPPLQGGLLVARYGKGTYVYTGLSFFRELPAGVPGAFRLFANLLGLGAAPAP
ncbi:MAG TPA: PIG-L family deacetylase [Gemmatimonadales bacterium]|nr:PIG-L family deacetylase [Gemmatimonadales bacterium]